MATFQAQQKRNKREEDLLAKAEKKKVKKKKVKKKNQKKNQKKVQRKERKTLNLQSNLISIHKCQ